MLDDNTFFEDKWGCIDQMAQRNDFHNILLNFSEGVSNNVLLILRCHSMINTF